MNATNGFLLSVLSFLRTFDYSPASYFAARSVTTPQAGTDTGPDTGMGVSGFSVVSLIHNWAGVCAQDKFAAESFPFAPNSRIIRAVPSSLGLTPNTVTSEELTVISEFVKGVPMAATGNSGWVKVVAKRVA